MFRARLRVSDSAGSRWDPVRNRWQNPGEEIIVETSDAEEYRRQLFLHSAHCELLEGELPKDSPAFVQRIKEAASAAVTAVVEEVRQFATLAEMRGESEAPKSTPVVGETSCPGCGKKFRSKTALEKHQQRSGHGKPK